MAHIPLRDVVKDADKLAAKRQELQQLQFPDAREWALNRAFYKGNQWVFWNPVATQVEALPTGDNSKARVRLVDNQILPGVNYWVAQLVKTKPVIGATPNSGSDRDIKSAQMAEALYDHIWEELTLKSRLQTALTHAALSQGYWKITWDPLAGVPMKFMMNPHTGQPIADDQLADIYREEIEQTAEQNGIDPALILQKVEQTVYVGEIKVEAIPGENVWLDMNCSSFEDATFAVCKHAMDPDEVMARFGVEVDANSAPADPDMPVMFSRKSDQRPRTTRDVFVGYFRPTPQMPKGRYVAWIEEPNKILYESDWPYPFTELPLVKFPGFERPNSPIDEPVTTHARPLQKELNRTISQVIQHKDLTLKPQMIAPTGSLRERLTDEPGAVFQFNPVAGLEPKWREMPGLPAYVFAHLDRIQQRIEEKYNKLPSKRDSMPARVDAGYSIELIQEAVADQISPISNRLEVALARAGKIIALLAQKYYTEPRLIKIKGSGGTVQVKKFINSDISGGFSFYAEAETGLPKTRAGRQMRIKELVEMGVLKQDQAWKHLDIGDLKGLATQFQTDEDQALREHEKLIKGQPLNPFALEEAIQAVQQGINPQTGQPMQDPQYEANQIIQQAMVAHLPYENPDAHLEVHGTYMKSAEYEALPQEAKQRFVDHYNDTLSFSIQLRKAALAFDLKALPTVRVSTAGTTSAATMGAILRAHGIDVTDEQVAQEPLETSVYDSMDKPDQDEAGNDPMSDLEQGLMIESQQAQNAANIAKTSHTMQLAQNKHQADQSILGAQQGRAEELHQQALEHAHEKHQQAMAHAERSQAAKEKQMSKPQPKPTK